MSPLQLPHVINIDEEGEGDGGKLNDELLAWKPEDLYDIAISGARVDSSHLDDNLKFECAAIQSEKAATHISISSFLLTQQPSVHNFIANTLLHRWTSLESFKLACQRKRPCD